MYKKKEQFNMTMAEQLDQMLEERRQQLLELQEHVSRGLKNPVEGSLRIVKNKKGIQYYYRVRPEDTTGQYLNKKKQALVSQLVQKEYDQKIEDAIKKEIVAIESYISLTRRVENVYGSLRMEKQQWIVPYFKSKQAYIEEWENFEYEGLGFEPDTPELYTDKGERVRSKSEIIIANMLNKYGIPYRYECPIYLKGKGIVYPDFTVLNPHTLKEMYWEHLGRMGDLDYCNKNLKKIDSYENNGIMQGDRLLLTYETSSKPLNAICVKGLIEHFLLN